MSEQALPPSQTITRPTITPAVSGLLQRACACGQHSGSGGACEECKKKREGTLQRAAINPAPVPEVPPIVHEVLRSQGQPLDAATRSFMEPRFGRDFSGVRIHTAGAASESARAVNAHAYTVGNSVVFGAGQYAPTTNSGRRLLAHELAHTIQQAASASALQTQLTIGGIDTPAEIEAERTADRVTSGQAIAELSHSSAPLIAREVASREMPTSDGGVDKVDRNVTPGKCALVPQTQTSTSGDITASKAFLQIDLCRGSVSGQIRGELDYGDALQQAGQAVSKLLTNASSGQPSAQVLSTLANDLKQLKPGAQIKMNLLASDVFRLDITGLGEASVEGGASGKATARAEFNTGPVKLSVEGSVSGGTQQQTEYVITGNITFGGSKQRAPDCFICACSDPKITYHCAHIPGKGNKPPGKPPVTPQPRYVPYFFEYSDITPNPKFVSLNQTNLYDVVGLLDEGYTIARIEGSASPEGPAHRTGPGTSKPGHYKYSDNTRLAEDRAVEGKKRLDEAIQLAMQSPLRMRTDALKAALHAQYPIIGRGELFGANDKGEVPNEGLLQHLQKTLEPRPEGEPDPLAQEHVTGQGLSDKVQAEMQANREAFRTGQRGDKKLTKQQRLEAAYEPLRRALIVLQPPPLPPPRIRLTPKEVENIVGKPIACTNAHRALFAGMPITQPFEGQCQASGRQGDKP